MKLASFSHRGRMSYGIVSGTGLIDVGARLGEMPPDLRLVLETDALGRVERLAGRAADVGLDEVTLLKPIVNPGKTVCVGVNYRGRHAEYRDGADEPAYPSLFLRVPESFVAHQEPLIRPPESIQLDYEGEVAVVIGRRGRRIPSEAALDHIAGYTICNEGTVRDWCKHGKFNVTAGKNFAGSGAIGPFLVTRDETGDGPFHLTTSVNGEVRQDDTTDRMIFPIPALLAYISTFCTLEPGDIVVTGTPTGAGVRFDPPRFLVPGDHVEVAVGRVGTLANVVTDERGIVSGAPVGRLSA